MCRDQNLISETNERTDERTDERMKIEKPGVGRPLLGPAKNHISRQKPRYHCTKCYMYHSRCCNLNITRPQNWFARVTQPVITATLRDTCENSHPRLEHSWNEWEPWKIDFWFCKTGSCSRFIYENQFHQEGDEDNIHLLLCLRLIDFLTSVFVYKSLTYQCSSAYVLAHERTYVMRTWTNWQ